jgi:chorismate mutase
MSKLSPDVTARLQNYRSQIDAIDDQLIALLKQRIGIVAQVGKMKREETPLKNFIRSGREAVMVKRLYEEFRDSNFHPAAAAAMWRLIISASIHHEAPLNVATTNALTAVGAEYFGSFMPQQPCANDIDALKLAAQDKQTIAVIAIDSAALLAQPAYHHLKIFALLPYIPSPLPRPQAYAVAQLIPEDTGEDVSIFYTENLIALEGYHTQQPKALWLGSYAKPIVAD